MNIGVTGGIGCGKSSVAKELTEQIGGKYINADLLCRDLLEVGNPGYQELTKNFSKDFFLADGSINRPLLRKTIFSDSIQRARLDDILHPLVREELIQHALNATNNKYNLVAEVPLLFEKGWQGDFGCSLVVFTDIDTCIARIMKRDFVTVEDAMAAISSQMPLAEKCKYGDSVIDNSGTFDRTIALLEQFVAEMTKNSIFYKKT